MELSFSPEKHVKKRQSKSSFRWTGDTISLIELAYALLETGNINKGEVVIKDFMEFLSKCFNIEIKRPADFYYKMRSRSGSRTVFIDKMKKLLELRMDRNDERGHTK